MLTKQVIENGAIFFVDALHFVDMFGYLFHAFQGVCQNETHRNSIKRIFNGHSHHRGRTDEVLMFTAIGIGQVTQLLQQEWIL
jgi:hypothetical protein